MIIERLNEICEKKGISITALCKEITGSSGNLPTWKKDRIRSDWLREICIKFNISSDYLLGLTTDNTLNASFSKEEREALSRFNRLNPDHQIKAQSYMIELYEKQAEYNEWIEKVSDRAENHGDSVAAEEPLKKTGTTNSAKY